MIASTCGLASALKAIATGVVGFATGLHVLLLYRRGTLSWQQSTGRMALSSTMRHSPSSAKPRMSAEKFVMGGPSLGRYSPTHQASQACCDRILGIINGILASYLRRAYLLICLLVRSPEGNGEGCNHSFSVMRQSVLVLAPSLRRLHLPVPRGSRVLSFLSGLLKDR